MIPMVGLTTMIVFGYSKQKETRSSRRFVQFLQGSIAATGGTQPAAEEEEGVVATTRNAWDLTVDIHFGIQ